MAVALRHHEVQVSEGPGPGRSPRNMERKTPLMPLMSAAQGTWPTNQRVDRHPRMVDDPQAGMHHDAHF